MKFFFILSNGFKSNGFKSRIVMEYWETYIPGRMAGLRKILTVIDVKLFMVQSVATRIKSINQENKIYDCSVRMIAKKWRMYFDVWVYLCDNGLETSRVKILDWRTSIEVHLSGGIHTFSIFISRAFQTEILSMETPGTFTKKKSHVK